RGTGRNVDSALGMVIEQGGGHLRAAGIVDADEEHFRDFLHDASSYGYWGWAECPELPPDEAVDERGDKIGGAATRHWSSRPSPASASRRLVVGSASWGTTTSAANVLTAG